MTNQSNDGLNDQNEATKIRSEKLQKIRQLGIDPWGMRFDNHQKVEKVLTLPSIPFDDNPTENVRIAGRIVLRRVMGKVHFLHLWDHTGRIQVMIGQKQIGELGWKLAELLDLGDQIGIEGVFGKTKTGEPTVKVLQLTFLGKSLEPHPEKFHGMSDMEYRLRHRYLDLIYTPETLERSKQRIVILRTIREYLEKQDFFEVETPIFHAIPGGAAARPFITQHNALDIQLYLRIALELHLKRLLVGGLERVFEIGRVFRNEGIDQKHNPEFTMLELYQAYGDYRSMMDLTEGLILSCIDKLGGGYLRPWGSKQVDFTPPWKREKYADLFLQYVGVALTDQNAVVQQAQKHHIPIENKEHDVLVHELFERCVEHHLEGPIFVCDYPAALCPLTKRKWDNPAIAERFELYIHGMELANAYTELNDPDTQAETFRRQLTGLPEEESMAKMDQEFITALRHGMPPAGGLGIGIDRLVMLLTNTQSIRDVILFPLLRPEQNNH